MCFLLHGTQGGPVGTLPVMFRVGLARFDGGACGSRLKSPELALFHGLHNFRTAKSLFAMKTKDQGSFMAGWLKASLCCCCVCTALYTYTHTHTAIWCKHNEGKSYQRIYRSSIVATTQPAFAHRPFCRNCGNSACCNVHCAKTSRTIQPVFVACARKRRSGPSKQTAQ